MKGPRKEENKLEFRLVDSDKLDRNNEDGIKFLLSYMLVTLWRLSAYVLDKYYGFSFLF